MVAKVVEAVGTAVRSDTPGLGELLEAAMVKAVEDAQAEGITDPDEIKARKQTAMDTVLAERDRQEAEATLRASQEG